MVSWVTLDDHSFLDRLRQITSLSIDARSSRKLQGFDEFRVFLVGFDLVTTFDASYPVLCQESVCTVRVIVDSSKECGGGIGTDSALDEVTSSRVIDNERSDIVNESSDDHELTSGAGILELIPGDDGKIVAGLGPFNLASRSSDSLQLHGDLTTLDGCIREGLELTSETEFVGSPNEPLGGIVLESLDRVTVILRELVVEVVVTFSDGDKGGEPVVLRGVLVVEGSLSEPVSERVDAEGRVVNEEKTSGSREEEPSSPISPSKTSYDGREDESHTDDEVHVPTVLPADNLVLGEIGDIGNTGSATRLNEHPSNVRPPESLVSRVRVEVGIGVAMVSTVTTRPPFDRTFNCARSSESEEILQRKRSRVCLVCPQTMVTCRHSETSVEVVQDRPEGGLPPDFCRKSTIDGKDGDHGESESRNDVYVLG